VRNSPIGRGLLGLGRFRLGRSGLRLERCALGEHCGDVVLEHRPRVVDQVIGCLCNRLGGRLVVGGLGRIRGIRCTVIALGSRSGGGLGLIAFDSGVEDLDDLGLRRTAQRRFGAGRA
jgi:hypothetical protein